jgi:hypothetical protein
VVFNGYFLKIMKYAAADVDRGAPVLVGRIGWEPGEASAPAAQPGMSPTLRWTLIALGAMFFISLVRWSVQFRRVLARPDRSDSTRTIRTDELDPVALDEWVQSVAHENDAHADPDREVDGP